jgi:hypothetical protein
LLKSGCNNGFAEKRKSSRHADRVFFLTEDIEKTHYSYDLISGVGSIAIPPLLGMLNTI